MPKKMDYSVIFLFGQQTRFTFQSFARSSQKDFHCNRCCKVALVKVFSITH